MKSAEEVVVPSGRQIQRAELAPMDRNNVIEPHGQVEACASAQMKHAGERVGSRPGFREIAAEIHLIVALQQAAEEEPIKPLGLCIGAEARVEIGGAGFDEEGQRRRVVARGPGTGS
jgi:hypothetical protein